MQMPQTLDIKGAETHILHKLEKELSPMLTYHSVEHTLDVLEAAMRISATEKITDEEWVLLRIAALYHDSGYLFTYKNHEEKSCEFAQNILPSYGFNPLQLASISKMILATKTPHHPKSILECIICDADLDYLGRDDVEIIANKLFEELKSLSVISTKSQWREMQIRFLETHQYYTSFSQQNRIPKKHEYLERLRSEHSNL